MRIVKRAMTRKQEGPGRFSFRGRASRWEYCKQLLLCSFVLGVGSTSAAAAVIGAFGGIIMTAVTSRRLHDLTRSGWLQVIPWLPLVLAAAVTSFASPLSPLHRAASGNVAPVIASLAKGEGSPLEIFSTVLFGTWLVLGTIFQLWLLFAPGAKGPNLYGEGNNF
jgi:uncharacterized membrane protein YhaH (DUF805 family)